MKPIIVVRTDSDKFHTMSPELDVHTVARIYDPAAGGLVRLVTSMLEDHPAQISRYREMLHNFLFQRRTQRRASGTLSSRRIDADA